MSDVREILVKAVSIGEPDVDSAAIADVDGVERLFSEAGAIDPPLPLRKLLNAYERSNALRQNVDAYSTNIDGFGHRFVPIIDLDHADADQEIAHTIYLERLRAVELGSIPEALEPTGEEVRAYKARLAKDMRIERSQLENFFDFCSADTSFVTLRRQLRQDTESLGNSYLEVLRDGTGKVVEFVYIPAFTMRLLPTDKQVTPITRKVRVSPLMYEDRPSRKRFRRFVQIHEQRKVFFKEYGDPRNISRKTGEVVRAFEGDDAPATEIMHFRVHTSRTAYGIPRWIGTLTAVIGSREAEEVNLAYFTNKSVPPLAVLVSGGTITDEAIKRIEAHINGEIKGKANFHKILFIEAESAGNAAIDQAARTRIELKPLTMAQQKDALFQEYDAANQDKVGMSFRLPRMLRGDIRDFNRSTAEAALDFAEQQVFAPERKEFDFQINRKLLAEMGVRFWRFQSLGPELRDTEQLAKIIRDLTAVGILTPEEARQLAEKVFGEELARITDDWVKQPLALTIAGFPIQGNSALTPFTGEAAGPGQDRAAYGDADASGILDDQERQAPNVPAVTPSILGASITMNEVRSLYGFGPKKLADGTDDPEGNQVVNLSRDASRGIAYDAHQLLALHKVLASKEAAEAAKAFYTKRMAENF